MCGPSRPSTGQRIAVIFPNPTTKLSTSSGYSILFRNGADATKAVFRVNDHRVFDILSGCRGIDLRIEQHGDLTAEVGSPLHQFMLRPGISSGKEWEFELGKKLELEVSEDGIVGRRVTVDIGGEVGMGVVGYD